MFSPDHCAFADIGDDFDLAVRMARKAGLRLDPCHRSRRADCPVAPGRDLFPAAQSSPEFSARPIRFSPRWMLTLTSEGD